MNKSIITRALTSLSLLLAASVNANLQQYDSTQDDVEVISVTGEYSKHYFLKEMRKAEVDFFDIYNTLTTNKDFKVHCTRKPKHHFTRITKRVCEANFVKIIDAQNTQDKFQAVSPRKKNSDENPSLGQSAVAFQTYPEKKKQRDKQIEELKALVLSSPKLQKQLIKLLVTKADYQKKVNQ